MNAHSKAPFVATSDGIFKLGPEGHYEPYEPADEHYSAPVTALVWAAFWTAGVALAYLLYLAAQAWLG